MVEGWPLRDRLVLLCLAGLYTLLYVAGAVDDSISSVMLVGHNPGMEGAVRVLTGHAEAMPTAAVAVIDLDIDSWKAIASGRGSLRAIFRPRDEMDATVI